MDHDVVVYIEEQYSEGSLSSSLVNPYIIHPLWGLLISEIICPCDKWLPQHSDPISEVANMLDNFCMKPGNKISTYNIDFMCYAS